MKGKPMVIVLIVLSGLILTCIGLALSDWKEDNTPRTPEQIQAGKVAHEAWTKAEVQE